MKILWDFWSNFWGREPERPNLTTSDLALLKEIVESKEPPYQQIGLNWIKIAEKVIGWGGRVELKIEEPATREEVEQLSDLLWYTLPDEIQNLLLKFSKGVRFNYFIPSHIYHSVIPTPIALPHHGETGWSIREILGMEEIRQECESRSRNYWRLWKNKVIFSGVGEDHFLAMDRRNPTESKPIEYIFYGYLNEELLEMGNKGHVIATNLNEYLLHHSLVGCPNTTLHILQKFANPETGLLDPNTEFSKKWRDVWGL